MSTLEELRRAFRLADAFDIAFVALFLYTLFMWFKATASRQVLVGIAVLAAIYLIARRFDMYMTAAVFQAALTFTAVALIVVFQEDLRRAFARIASLGKLPRLGGSGQITTDCDVLIETAFELAEKKVGAIIAIRGDEPLERHLRGGSPVDARISKALLDSIFDPHSMGHDGAVIIEQDRIRHFAAHLPLSQDLESLGTRGTRHSAALGLSEVSDAIVIVVSEERGQVSLAANGKLETISTATELKKRLERFAGQQHPKQRISLRHRLLRDNAGLKLASVALACLAWFLISFEAEIVQKTFVVPVEYRKLPENMVIEDAAPTEARITLSGYERAFNLMVPSALKVSLDLSSVEEGQQQIVIEEAHTKLPQNLTLFRALPRVLSFRVHRWTRSTVDVEPRIESRLPENLKLESITVSPETIQILIWQSQKANTKRVYTEPIDLSRITKTADLKTKLVLPQHIRFEAGQSPEVQVKVNVVSTSESP